MTQRKQQGGGQFPEDRIIMKSFVYPEERKNSELQGGDRENELGLLSGVATDANGRGGEVQCNYAENTARRAISEQGNVLNPPTLTSAIRLMTLFFCFCEKTKTDPYEI